jgi:signal transduction protein with GAF and PtsI domain
VKKVKHYYENLYEIARMLNSERDPEAIPNLIAENVTSAVGVKGCSLMLYNYSKTVLVHAAAYGLSEQYIKKGPLSADKSISEVLKGSIVAIFDATKDKRIQYPDEAAQEGIVSMLSVPMIREGGVIGVIRLYMGKPYNFSADDVYFVNAVANLGAIALMNTKSFRRLENEYDAFRRSTF